MPPNSAPPAPDAHAKTRRRWRFESIREPLLPRRLFVRRLMRWLGLAGLLVFLALGTGVLGYHIFAGFSWIDSLLNASMILSGMGPVGELRTDGAKLFASAYALFSGVVFISSIGVVAAPMVHRLLHGFHVEEDGA
jgi:hypothetical protein